MEKMEIEPRDSDFTKNIIARAGSEVLTCMQCGTCSGSCPTSSWMDHSPREIVRMIQLGLKDEVLASNTPWLCATCYHCTVRCPREIKITEVMNTLRNLALSSGIKNRVIGFDCYFLEYVKNNGRISEVSLMAGYGLKNPSEMIKQLPLALTLLRKGRLPLLKEKVEEIEDLKNLFDMIDRKGDEA